MDKPEGEQHKKHIKATPLLGGAGMFTAWLLTLSVSIAVYIFSPEWLHLPELSHGIAASSIELLAMVACALFVMLFGLKDDCKAMKAWQKLILQILAAVFTFFFTDAKITAFIPSQFLSFCLTVFWFILIFNAINFFDNMDGLAAGSAVIALIFFTIASLINKQFLTGALSAATAGAAAGFWYFNRFPAKIFMGDSGSHFLAYMLAYISAKVTYFTTGESNTHFALLIPIFILAIPLLDACTVVIIRLINHKPIYVGDHNHISHRFRHTGLSQANSVRMVHLLSIIAGTGALPLLRADKFTCIFLIFQGITLYFMICFLQYLLREKNNE